MRGEIYRLRAPRDARGHEQSGARYAVVVQSDDLPLTTWLIAPTSTSARPMPYRPKITVRGQATLVLADQMTAVDHVRLGEPAGYLKPGEMAEVDDALRLVLALR